MASESETIGEVAAQTRPGNGLIEVGGLPVVGGSNKRVVPLKCGTEPSRMLGAGYIMIEHAVEADGSVLLVGWVSKGAKMLVPEAVGHARTLRPDADALVGSPTVGFAIMTRRGAPSRNVGLFIDAPDMLYELTPAISKREADLAKAITAARRLVPTLLPCMAGSRIWGELALGTVSTEDNISDRARGQIAEARTPGIGGGIATGWAVTRGPIDLYLASEDGTWRSLKDAVRVQRDDIVGSYDIVFGPHTAEAGFLCALSGSFVPGQKLLLIAALRDRLVRLHEMVWQPAPTDPVSFARWAFALQAPPSRFAQRLEDHDGPIIEALIEAETANRKLECTQWAYGTQPADPQVSVIVPLFGRTDFVEHQLLALSEDPDFSSGRAELIYVLDDPRIIEPMRSQAVMLERLYRVPFRLLWGGLNRGFSGANNLGVTVARGDTLVFVNSDVFPQEHGWTLRMAQALRDRPDLGALGARLHYADGGLQHLGMKFRADDGTGFWLNTHPHAGSDSGPTPAVIEVEAATAACLAVRRDDFNQIGGFDERYLIGDFEDSDLILRLRALRGSIGVLSDTRLVHLERQTFPLLGEGEFRQSVVWFNAWRHHRLWKDEIAQLSGGGHAA